MVLKKISESWLRPENFLRDIFAEPLRHLYIQMCIPLEHLQRAVAHCGGEFEVGGALRSGERCEGVAHVVCPAIGDSSNTQDCLPGFLDVDAAKGGFTGKHERLEGMAEFVEALELINDGIGEGDAAGTAIFSLLQIGEAIIEV